MVLGLRSDAVKVFKMLIWRRLLGHLRTGHHCLKCLSGVFSSCSDLFGASSSSLLHYVTFSLHAGNCCVWLSFLCVGWKVSEVNCCGTDSVVLMLSFLFLHISMIIRCIFICWWRIPGSAGPSTSQSVASFFSPLCCLVACCVSISARRWQILWSCLFLLTPAFSPETLMRTCKTSFVLHHSFGCPTWYRCFSKVLLIVLFVCSYRCDVKQHYHSPWKNLELAFRVTSHTGTIQIKQRGVETNWWQVTSPFMKLQQWMSYESDGCLFLLWNNWIHCWAVVTSM